MKTKDNIIINQYKNYLIRTKQSSTVIHMNIKSIDDVYNYEKQAQLELEKLEEMSSEYKLYDKHYEEYRIAMGKFAIGISKSYKLQLKDEDKIRLTKIFVNFNNRFEDLFQKNIMKDVYIWK